MQDALGGLKMDGSPYVPLEPGKAYLQQQKAKFEASKISVLIPVHNAAGNINILYTEIISGGLGRARRYRQELTRQREI